MAKRTFRENFRVEVYARSPGDFGFGFISGFRRSETEWEQECKEIASQIERHVDGLPSRGAKTTVVWDAIDICEHCGARWTEDSDTYNGGCCDKDEAAAPTTA